MNLFHQIFQRFGFAILVFFLSLFIWGYPHLDLTFHGLIPVEIGLSSDECFSIYHAQFPVTQIWQELSTGNNPPLFESILHFWIQIFGDSSYAVHLLTLIFLSLTAAILFQWLWQEFESLTIAGSTILFFWSSNYTALLALEARAYALLLLLSTVSTYLFFRAIKSKNTSAQPIQVFRWMSWGICSALMAYTHFFGLWVMAVQVCYFGLSSDKKWTSIKPFIGGILSFLILYAPYISTLILRFLHTASDGTWVEAAPWSAPYYTIWKYANNPVATILVLGIISFGIVTIFKHQKRDFERVKPKSKWDTPLYLLIAFAAPMLITWLLSVPSPWCTPMFTERYTSFVMPALFGLLAWSIYQIPKPSFVSQSSWALTITTLLVAIMISNKNPHQCRQAPAKAVMDELSFLRTDQSYPVVMEPYHAAFQVLYYANRPAFRQYNSRNIYQHLQNQLAMDSIYILKTSNSYDSLHLHSRKQLYYMQLNPSKSDQTKKTESQLFSDFNLRSKLIEENLFLLQHK